MTFSTLFAGLVLLTTPGWAQYVLQDDYMQNGFFNQFSFWNAGDPTNGFVKYVDQATASSNGLLSTSSNQVSFGVDSTNNSPNGRMSVRLTSRKSYNSGLIIADIAHMPGGICGTWPAFWTVGPNWPAGGEIDIIEGVNDQAVNDMTLHTNAGCTISKTGAMSGSVLTTNCDVNAAGQSNNQGCSITTSNTQTYGSGFNAIGGGVYAVDWTSSFIKVYFFPRGSIPSDITSGKPKPAGWGNPVALFQGGCNIADKFKQQQIVFDTTFCGDWAGAVWGSSSCASKASSCSAYVANNPSAFKGAYWTINSLKVYQAQAGMSSNAVSESSSILASLTESAAISTPIATATSASVSSSTSTSVSQGISTSTPVITPSSPAEGVSSTPTTSSTQPTSTGRRNRGGRRPPKRDLTEVERHLKHFKRHGSGQL